MPYMNCPRCGLSIRLRASSLLLERCPRCLARAGAAIPMHISENQQTVARGPAASPPVGQRRPTPLSASLAPSPAFGLARSEQIGADGSRPSIAAADALPPVPTAGETILSTAPAPAGVPPPDQPLSHGFLNEWSY
jgi:hypothetical protein